MARFWDNKEVPGRGTKFCLVIDPEDGTHPIRTYGWSESEVLDKVAKTAETAQQTISRLRSAPAPTSIRPPNSPAPAPAPTRPKVTADEQMQATQDLTNPAKAPQAIKTLLLAAGVDVNRMITEEETRRVSAVAQEWERQHPDFPNDPRNQRLLIRTAALKYGFANITADALTATYQQLLNENMLFPVSDDPYNPPIPPNAPEGNPASRVERPRGATSYRSTALRGSAPVATTKPKYTRAEIDSWNSAKLREKIDHEPGFKEFYNSLMASA